MNYVLIVISLLSTSLFSCTQAQVLNKPHKIVGLVPVRNEASIVAQALKALSLYTDAIVVLDDDSDDNTVAVIEKIAQECSVEKIIRKEVWFRDEAGDRNMLLQAGREVGGTHFVVIDADEMFTANCKNNDFLRKTILQLHPGDRLGMTHIQMWGGIQRFRYIGEKIKFFIFCDDGVCSYGDKFLHEIRTPLSLRGGSNLELRDETYGLMHFSFVNFNNMYIKQSWYQCLEHVRDPLKSTQEINNIYRWYQQKDVDTYPVLHQWLAGYSFFDRHVFDDMDLWRYKQVQEWLAQYGRDWFADLEIWHVDWDNYKKNKPKISIITSVYKGDLFIESFMQDIVQQTIFDQCELILINAHSPGNEDLVVKKYMEQYANIKYMKLESDPGLYGVWNQAIEIAQGQYITNANLDDRLKYDCYQVLAQALDEHPEVDLVYSDCLITYRPNETFICNTHEKVMATQGFSRENVLTCAPGSNPMWRKDMHTKYGLFDTQYTIAGDYEMWLRAMQGGAQFLKVPGVHVLYYFNPYGLSTQASNSKILDERFAVNKKYAAFFK